MRLTDNENLRSRHSLDLSNQKSEKVKLTRLPSHSWNQTRTAKRKLERPSNSELVKTVWNRQIKGLSIIIYIYSVHPRGKACAWELLSQLLSKVLVLSKWRSWSSQPRCYSVET